MKAKKAMKRLQRVETLLGTVIDQFDASTREFHDLLAAARSSVASATRALVASPPTKAPAKAKQTPARKQSNGVRKRLPVAVKKREPVAKRDDASNVAKSPRKIA